MESACRHEVVENANFCPVCGEKTEYYYNKSEFPMEKEYEIFVGANSDYYLDQWEDASNPSFYAGFNWAIFFFGIFWFGFRKMFIQQFLICISFGLILYLTNGIAFVTVK